MRRGSITWGLLLALLGGGVFPLAMFLTYARNDRGWLGLGRGGSLLLRYPLATFLALMVVPLGVVVAEGLTTLFMVWQGEFRFLLLELFPDSLYYGGQYKIHPSNYTRPYLPDPRFYHLYFRRLHQGYAFITALPASLSCTTAIMSRPSPWTFELTDAEYLQMRVKHTLVVTLIFLLFLALQARWLGAISTLESKLPAEVEDRAVFPCVGRAEASETTPPGPPFVRGGSERVDHGFRRPFASARAVRGSSGQECLGYRARRSLRT